MGIEVFELVLACQGAFCPLFGTVDGLRMHMALDSLISIYGRHTLHGIRRRTKESNESHCFVEQESVDRSKGRKGIILMRLLDISGTLRHRQICQPQALFT